MIPGTHQRGGQDVGNKQGREREQQVKWEESQENMEAWKAKGIQFLRRDGATMSSMPCTDQVMGTKNI